LNPSIFNIRPKQISKVCLDFEKNKAALILLRKAKSIGASATQAV
jgi:hypothetical protein